MQTHYRVLGYEIDIYSHDYKLAVEIDDYNLEDSDIGCEIKRQKALDIILIKRILMSFSP